MEIVRGRVLSGHQREVAKAEENAVMRHGERKKRECFAREVNRAHVKWTGGGAYILCDSSRAERGRAGLSTNAELRGIPW